MSLSHQLFFILSSLAHQNSVFDFFVQFFAVYFPYIVGGIAMIYIVYHKHKKSQNEFIFNTIKIHLREFGIVVFSVLFVWGFSALLKELVGAPRPYLVFQNFIPLFPYGGYDSFPSGHAGLFGAIAGAIYIFHHRAGFVFFICAILIGIARIIAGVHFPIDIFGGLCIGFIGVQLVYWILLKIGIANKA